MVHCRHKSCSLLKTRAYSIHSRLNNVTHGRFPNCCNTRICLRNSSLQKFNNRLFFFFLKRILSICNNDDELDSFDSAFIEAEMARVVVLVTAHINFLYSEISFFFYFPFFFIFCSSACSVSLIIVVLLVVLIFFSSFFLSIMRTTMMR